MTKSKIINRLKVAKAARRKELAKLSFPEKILTLIRLQKIVDSVNKVKGGRRITIWKI